MEFKQFLQEASSATLILHPERGVEIRPSGGMGSWTVDRLSTDVVKMLLDLSNKIKAQDYEGVDYILFKNDVFKAKVQALAGYDRFKTKQGKRAIPINKEIDIT